MKLMGKIVSCFLITSCLMASDHRVLLKFENETVANRTMAHCGISSYEKLQGQALYRCQIKGDMPESQLMSQLEALPGVVGCEKEQPIQLIGHEPAVRIDQRAIMILDAQEGPAIGTGQALTQEELLAQSFISQVSAESAWNYSRGAGSVVAVLDTGIDPDHPFFENQVSSMGYDFVDNDNDPFDERNWLDFNGNGFADEGWGHGTHVAGIVKMVAPDVTILPIRVVNSDGIATLFDVIQGIHYAIGAGADIINLSLSVRNPSQLLREAIYEAFNKDVLVVTSAGNESKNQMDFPANEPLVLAVASVDDMLHKSSFSNYSPNVDVSAPGEAILSCLPGGGYVARTGTSMSAPMAAAQAAILRDWFYEISALDLVHHIRDSSRSLDPYNPNYTWQLGGGIIDVGYSLWY